MNVLYYFVTHLSNNIMYCVITPPTLVITSMTWGYFHIFGTATPAGQEIWQVFAYNFWTALTKYDNISISIQWHTESNSIELTLDGHLSISLFDLSYSLVYRYETLYVPLAEF